MRPRVIEMQPTAPPRRHDDDDDDRPIWTGPREFETLIGQTEHSQRGYRVAVVVVKFPGAGERVRQVLLYEGNGQTRFAHHLDLTVELLNATLPILVDAAKQITRDEAMIAPAATIGFVPLLTHEALQTKSRPELLELLTDANATTARIQKQMTEHFAAARDGLIERDEEWIRRANNALRSHKRLKSMIQGALGKVRERTKAENVAMAAARADAKPFTTALRDELRARFGKEAAQEILQAAGERERAAANEAT